MAEKEGYKYKFIWKIGNFSFCSQKTGEFIESPTFTVEHLSKCKWTLRIYPKGIDEKNSEFLSCCLKVKEPDDTMEMITVSLSVEIVDRYGGVLHSCTGTSITFSQRGKRNSRGWNNFFSLDKLDTNTWSDDTLILQVYMSDQAKQLTNVTQGCEARTVVGVSRCDYKLDVKIPHILPLLEIIKFAISDIAQFEASISNSSEYIEITLRCSEKETALPLPATFQMIFLNQEGVEICSKKESYLFKCTDDEKWNFPRFVPNELVQTKINGVMHYVFSLICVTSVSNGTIASSKIEKYLYSSAHLVEKLPLENSPSMLLNDFRGLFVSKKYSDIKLRVENNEFLAHKSVLAARSPVFAAMFDQDMSENKTGIVNIVDVEEKTLNYFLEYLYTESVSAMDYETAKALLMVADKYQVQSLKNECSRYLKSTLSVENACEVVTIADMVNAEMLKRFAINCIKTNALKILTSSDWLNWIEENNKLTSEILAELSLAFGDMVKKTTN